MKNDFNYFGASGDGRLSDLAPGSEAEVIAVDRDDATGRRLRDLGLLPRTRVRAVRRAPFGDPSVYELRGYRLCLRRAEAERVLVRLSAPIAGPPVAP